MMKRPLFILMLALGMSACSDDGGSSDPAPVVVHAQPVGIWQGCLTTLLEWEHKGKPANDDFACQDPLGAGQHSMLVVTDPQGRFRVFAEMGVVESYDEVTEQRTWTTAPFLAHGKVATTENESRAGWSLYTVNPATNQPASLESLEYRQAESKGEMATADFWRGTISLKPLDFFKFDLAYDEVATKKGANLAGLKGIWQNADSASELVTILIDADGWFETDANASGSCRYKGKISVPDSTRNFYRLSDVQVEQGGRDSCAGRGTQKSPAYGGVAVLIEENGVEVLKISLANEERMLNLNLIRN